MAGTVKHVFTSPKTDATDTSLVRPSDWNSSHVLTLDTHHVTLSGNTAGALALVSTGTMTLVGGNNITLSQAGNVITISGANQSVQAETQTFLGGIKNTETTYTSGTVELEGTNNITVLSTTGQRFRISGANTHAQQTALSGLANSQTTYTSGTVSMSELGAITIRSTTGNQYQFSVNAQTNQSAIRALGASNTGNTSGNTGVSTGIDWVFAGTNNVTISESTAGGGPNTLWVSGPTVGGAQTGISGISNSETMYTSGSVKLSELGAITIRSTTGQAFQFSVNAQSVQTQAITLDQVSIGVSTGGNTSGNTTVQTGNRFVLVGSNGITLSQGTGAGSTTVTISGVTTAAQTNQSAIKALGVSNTGNTAGNTGVSTGIDWVLAGTNNMTVSESTAAGGPNTLWLSAAGGGGGNFSGGVSNLGNTAGSTGVTGTRYVLVGTNNISLSQSTDANGGTVSIDGPKNFSAGVSTMGNTAGSTGVTGTRLVLVGTDGQTLSQSTDASGGTITLDPGPQVSFFRNIGLAGSAPGALIEATWTGFFGTPRVFPLNNWMPFPGVMTADTVEMLFSISGSTATMSAANSSTVDFAIYTNNAGSLSLMNSVSTSFGGAANANNSTSTFGFRWLTIHSSLWSVQPTFSRGNYWFFINVRTSSRSNQSVTQYGAGIQWSATLSTLSGTMGVATTTGATQGVAPFFGMFSATTASPPASIASNDLNKTGNNAVIIPLVNFNAMAGATTH